MIIQSINLHKGQQRIKDEIFKSTAKFHVINASRQSGKTTLLTQLALYILINSKCKVLYVAPVYSITKNVFNDIVEGIITSGIIKEYYKSDQKIIFLNGSEIVFKSASNYDNIRGGSYDFVFVDEFAYVSDDAWNAAIRPTLAVKGKKSFITSTPKGKNLFHKLAQLGISPDNDNYEYHYMNYKDNPYYDLNEIEDAKKTLPEAIFRQEYEAEFIDDGGSVFENISQLSTINEFIVNKRSGERYFAGLDLARQNDYTVLTIINQRKEVVYVYRANKKSWESIVNDVLKILLLFNPVLYVEVNSIGDVIFENIKKHFKRAIPFVTTQKSKQEIIEELIYEFSDLSIFIPTKELFEPLHTELEIFTFDYNKKSRTIHYTAPVGFNDDCVISLALANKANKHVNKSSMSWSTI